LQPHALVFLKQQSNDVLKVAQLLLLLRNPVGNARIGVMEFKVHRIIAHDVPPSDE